MNMNYDWLAALVTVASAFAIVGVGRWLVFKIPAIANTRQKDAEENKIKWRGRADRHQARVPVSQKIGLIINLTFFVAVLPFIVTMDYQPVWKVALDVFLILMVYDFFYYMTHRFVFHGKGFFRRVHAVHHQARSRVSSIDSLLLHPVEIFIGIALFYVVTVALSLVFGAPYNVATIIITTVIYTQINQINHCRIDLEGFPWKTLNWIAIKHDAHHLDMHKGNFATITLLFDRLFGTLEKHPNESL